MPRTGRPRAKGPSRSGLSTEGDIRVAAARLFCDVGFGSTSTYAIAQEAGISQATIYHYFADKQAILLALLLETVEPSVAYATRLADREEPTDVRLWALCAYDVRLLLGGRDHTGSLYLLPELGDERFAPFHRQRTRLYRVYRGLVADLLGVEPAVAHPQASLVFGLVESVILRRRTERGLDAEEVAPLIADASLRVLGVRESRIRSVHVQAERLAVESAG